MQWALLTYFAPLLFVRFYNIDTTGFRILGMIVRWNADTGKLYRAASLSILNERFS